MQKVLALCHVQSPQAIRGIEVGTITNARCVPRSSHDKCEFLHPSAWRIRRVSRVRRRATPVRRLAHCRSYMIPSGSRITCQLSSVRAARLSFRLGFWAICGTSPMISGRRSRMAIAPPTRLRYSYVYGVANFCDRRHPRRCEASVPAVFVPSAARCRRYNRVFRRLPRSRPASAQVIDFFRRLQADSSGPKVIALRGNHRGRVASCDRTRVGRLVLPTNNGCLAALRSFEGGAVPDEDEKPSPSELERLCNGAFFPPEVVAWLKQLPYFY